MVKVWKINNFIGSFNKSSLNKGSIESTQHNDLAVKLPGVWSGTTIAQEMGNKTLSEISHEPASKYVETQQRYCKYLNAESYSPRVDKFKLSLPLIKIRSRLNDLPEKFTIKNLFDLFPEVKGMTRGDIFRESLFFMNCNGEISKEIVIKEEGNGISYCFSKANREKCPFLQEIIIEKNGIQKKKLKCTFDWKDGEQRDDFKETKEEPDAARAQ